MYSYIGRQIALALAEVIPGPTNQPPSYCPTQCPNNLHTASSLALLLPPHSSHTSTATISLNTCTRVAPSACQRLATAPRAAESAAHRVRWGGREGRVRAGDGVLPPPSLTATPHNCPSDMHGC